MMASLPAIAFATWQDICAERRDMAADVKGLRFSPTHYYFDIAF